MRRFFLTFVFSAGALILGSVSGFSQNPTREVPAKTVALDKTAVRVKDDPLTDRIAEAKKAYQELKDYSCKFIKQERVNGKMLPEQEAILSIRCQPFSVHMKFTAPDALSGQEVCYVTGKNKGQMRVKSTGLKAALGFISLPLNDPRVMAMSRHTLKEAGIGALIDQLETVNEGRKERKYRIEVSLASINKRDCQRIEVLQLEEAKNVPYRAVIFFDKDHHLPIRFEAYERSSPEAKDSGDLIECYSYQELKLNPGLAEKTFEK